MVSSKACSSAAQPCTSPTANTVSPKANGAGLHAEISTGRVAAASMATMLSLSRAPLHRGQRAAIELLLGASVQVKAHRRRICARHPEMGGQGVVAVAHRLDAEIAQPQHALV